MDKTWNTKSIIVILFYLSAVAAFAWVPLNALFKALQLIDKLDKDSNFYLPKILIVLPTLAIPISFLKNRNLQGPARLVSLCTMLLVSMASLTLYGALVGKSNKNGPTVNMNDFLFDFIFYCYVTLPCAVFVYFWMQEKKELENLGTSVNTQQNLELETV